MFGLSFRYIYTIFSCRCFRISESLGSVDSKLWKALFLPSLHMTAFFVPTLYWFGFICTSQKCVFFYWIAYGRIELQSCSTAPHWSNCTIAGPSIRSDYSTLQIFVDTFLLSTLSIMSALLFINILTTTQNTVATSENPLGSTQIAYYLLIFFFTVDVVDNVSPTIYQHPNNHSEHPNNSS